MTLHRRGHSPKEPPLRHGSRSEHVYRRLRDAIQRGEYKSGRRVMEIEVAAWLKVSRTPVRDAIRRLEAEGMLEHEPRNGLVVARLDRQAVMELYVMREVLEGTAARLCARHASDMEIQELCDLIEAERQLSGDFEALARHNVRFHSAIHRSAHNRYLEKSLAAVNDSMGLLGAPLMLLPHRAETAAAEHARLVQAIQDRNPDAAEEVARAHVRAAQRERIRRLFPDSAA
ncbi:MAG: GntR family transcriptional regulator [Betaproteobacteria bacterium]|nr:GntR family transcriptional regulator [Betaproteobacteria bacterium]